MTSHRAVPELLARAVAALGDAAESRPGQVAMAEAVREALRTPGGQVAIRAGTGTGKTLAYLVPIIASGRRTVIATATKALQDQLAAKDLPQVVAALGADADDVTYQVIKGRSNYVCRQRLADRTHRRGGQQGALFDTDDDAGGADLDEVIERLEAWVEHSDDGDLDGLGWALPNEARRVVTVTPEDCPGADHCPSGKECFAEVALRNARDASIVVANTALLAVDLALDGTLLSAPERPFEAFVLDEAHDAEDIVAGALGAEVSPGLIEAAASAVASVSTDSAELVDRLRTAARGVAAAIGDAAGAERTVALPDGLPPGLEVAVARAAADVGESQRTIASIRKNVADAGAGAAKLERARRRCEQAAEHLGALSAPVGSDAVWVDGDPPKLRRVPVAIHDRLPERWAERSVILCSATLADNVGRRLGLAEAPPVVDVGSPFDHRAQSLLYVPRLLARAPSNLRKPDHEAWFDEAWAETRTLIEAAGGRALVLCTSIRNMDRFGTAARAELDLPVLQQGDAPKPALLEQFTADESAVLVATASYWQGVDVPGRSLSLVVIDRLPFPPVGDPLWAARRRAGGEGFEAFANVDVPRAASQLAQAAGRLIRTTDDRGVICVLDPRLAEKSYRRALLAVMPPARRSRDRADAVAMLREIAAG